MDYILDADPAIPSGVPATPEQVAEIIADPALPITADILGILPDWQTPTPEQLAEAVEAAS